MRIAPEGWPFIAGAWLVVLGKGDGPCRNQVKSS